MIFHVLFLLFVASRLHAERNSLCKTPNGEEARCVPIYSCSVLINSILTKNPDNIIFSKKSQCGYDTSPLVCCGSFGNFLPAATIFNRFSQNVKEKDEIQTPYSTFLDSLLPRNEICVTKNERIIRKSVFNTFPWVVALGRNSNFKNVTKRNYCKGVIISSLFIITDSQCVSSHGDNTNPSMKVLIGFSENFTCPANKCIEKNITSIITPKKNNGIFLLKVQSKITFNDDTKPICLSTNSKRTRCEENENRSILESDTKSDYAFSTNNKNEWYFEGIFQRKSPNSRVFISIADNYEWIVKNILRNM